MMYTQVQNWILQNLREVDITSRVVVEDAIVPTNPNDPNHCSKDRRLRAFEGEEWSR